MCLAVPGRVISVSDVDPLDRTAKVSFGGLVREVSVACVPDVAVGRYVLVHAGFALGVVDEEEAARLLAALEEAANVPSEGEGGDPLPG